MDSKNCIYKNDNMSDAEKAYADNMYEQYNLKFNDSDKAAVTTLKALTIEQKIRKADNLRAAKILAERLIDLDDITRITKDAGSAVLGFIAPDGRAASRKLNLENYQSAIQARALGIMRKLLKEYGRKGVLGLKGSGPQGMGGNNISIRDVLLEIEGKVDTGNAKAKSFAKAWKETAEYLRRTKNKYGAHIPKMEDWFMPQSHSQLKLRSVKQFSAWADYIIPLLDQEKMVSFKTGQPMTKIEFEFLLKEIYEDITGGGKKKGKNTSFSNTLSNHRILKFKDADSWFKYHEKFGEGDIFKNMLNYVEKMSMDIAELRVLGPKPQQTIDNLVDKMIDLKGSDDSIKIVTRKKVQDYYDVYKRRQLLSEREGFGNLMSATRNTFTAVYLGSAVFSAIGDFNTSMATMSRLGNSSTAGVKRHLKNIFQFVGADERKQFLFESGVILNNVIDFSQKKAKFAGETAGPEWSQHLSDKVIRASGLAAFTDGGRNAFAQEFMVFMAKQKGKKFNELNKELQDQLTLYGLDKDWDIISQADVYEFQGMNHLRYNEIDNLDIPGTDTEDIATRYLQMMHNMQDDAIIVGGVKTTAELYTATPRGAIQTELLKTAFMFKNFSVSVIIQHIYRMATDRFVQTKHFGVDVPVPVARAINMTKFIGMATLLGAIAEQLQEMKKGRDPKDMNQLSFWGAAFVRGGGLGFIGDFLNNTVQGYATEFFGPGVDLLADFGTLTIGNAYNASQGEDTEVSYDLMKFFGKYTPGQSLWYANLIYNRLLLENAAMTVDPEIARRLRTQARRIESRTDQEYWWSPGRTSPERAPDLEAAVENIPGF